MDDQGFDFRTAPERREPKRFEPPPWERDAFEELQRQRVTEEPDVALPATEAGVGEAAGGDKPEATGPTGPAAEDAAAEPEARREDAAVAPEARAEAPAAADTKPGEQSGPERPAGPSEAQVLELLAGLAAEEPDARAPATQVTVGATLVLLPIGVMMLFWGIAALVRAGAAQAGVGVARTGALILIAFGAGFIGSAFWLIYRLMKQRGVL